MAAAPVTVAQGYPALRAALPGDPYVRWDVDPARVGRVAVEGGAAAWLGWHPARRACWLTGVGAPGPLGRAMAALAGADGLGGVTVPRGTPWPVSVDAAGGGEWDWWWTAAAPPPRPGEAAVVAVPRGDPRLAVLLEESSPTASLRFDDPRVEAWAAVEEAGALVACAAAVRRGPGVPHLADVATRPDRRGRGLARDVCAVLVRRALAAGAPAATLGMYAGNAAAARTYAALGFVRSHRWSSAPAAG